MYFTTKRLHQAVILTESRSLCRKIYSALGGAGAGGGGVVAAGAGAGGAAGAAGGGGGVAPASVGSCVSAGTSPRAILAARLAAWRFWRSCCLVNGAISMVMRRPSRLLRSTFPQSCRPSSICWKILCPSSICASSRPLNLSENCTLSPRRRNLRARSTLIMRSWESIFGVRMRTSFSSVSCRCAFACRSFLARSYLYFP